MLLERYRVLAPIKEGGYGEVLLAFDERMQRRVAIKQLPLTFIGKVAVGLEEARTAALLNHPNIVSVYDFEADATSGLAYLIMEYVDGLSLADLPSDELSDEVIAAVAKALGAALSYAHKQGVLHLDVKPGNILIDHEGRIKLADFGMARLSEADGHGQARGGTLGYMPLEQLRGEPVSEASDQWAAAAVIYELVSDEYPYYHRLGRHTRIDRLIELIEAAEPELLTTASPFLDAAFTRALSRNPEVRFDSVKEFCDLVVAELGGTTAVSTGTRELRDSVATLTDDEQPDALAKGPEEDESRRRGCAAGLGVLAKITFALVLVLLILAYLAPQLFGDKRLVAMQAAGSVGIILLIVGLIAALLRKMKRSSAQQSSREG